MSTKLQRFLLPFVALCIAGIALFFFKDFFIKPQNEESAPGALIALVTNPTSVGLSVKDLSGKSPVSVLTEFDGKVVDYARNDHGEALLHIDSATHVAQVRSHNSDEWYVVSRSPNEKNNIVLSRDGHYVAYAELINHSAPLELSSWEVYFFDRITSDLFSMGPGYAPHFLVFSSEDAQEQEMLVFNTPRGLSLAPTIAREEGGLFIQEYEVYVPTSVDDVMRFSSRNVPGTTIAIAYNPIFGEYDIFNIPPQYFDLEFRGSIEVDGVLGVSGNVILTLQGGDIKAYLEPGTDILETVRAASLGDAQSITKIIMSEYE